MMSILNCKSLKEVEPLLEPKFNGIAIISEVPVFKTELMNIEQMFKRVFTVNNRNQQAFIKSIWHQYPFSCLAVTVYIGIYYYDGNYWGHFTSKTGCTDDQTWKECFMVEIERRGLFVFDRLGSQRYVSTILGHAGVPQNSFDGFANGFLKPAYDSGLGAADALIDMFDEEYDNVSGIKSYMMHKGVRDYLRTGGKVAEDFVDRCLQLVSADLTSLEAYKHVLPRRILKLFQDWQKSREHNVGVDGKQERLLAPEVKLDPYIVGVYIQLPTQQLKDRSLRSAAWRIRVVGEAESYFTCDLVELRSIGEYQIIPRSSRPSLVPNKIYEVDFDIDGICRRKWRFHTSDPLVFDKKSQSQVRKAANITADQWIVMNKNFELMSNQRDFMDVSKEKLYGEWSEYSLWEIGAGVRTMLAFSDGIQKTVLSLSAETDKPFFKREPRSVIWQGSTAAFYDWPVLCVPAASYPDFRKVSENWRLQLIHSQTQWRAELGLHELVDNIKLVGQYYEIPVALLCPEPNIGSFNVKMLAGLGSDIHLSFVKLPFSLSVESISSPIFPQQNGVYPTQSFEVVVEEPYILSCVGPSSVEFLPNFNREDGNRSYRMAVPQQVSQVSFQFYDPLTSESCELHFLPKALSWYLLDDHRISFRNELIKLDEQQMIEKSGLLRTVIDTTNMQFFTDSKFLNVTMRLEDYYGITLMEKQRKIRIGTRFILDPIWFMETIRDCQLPICRIWVDIPHLLARPFVLLEINKQWTVSDIKQELTDHLNMYLTWKENFATGNRVLCVWDEWHPWKGHQEYIIPDGVSELTILQKDYQERGHYLFEWSTTIPGGLFSFLQETHYPFKKENCYRWYNGQGLASDNPLAETLLGSAWNGEGVPFNNEHVTQLLHGLRTYGEGYLSTLRGAYWKTFFNRHKEQVIDWIDNGLPGNPEDVSLLIELVGIEEWNIDDILKVNASEAALWKSTGSISTSINHFGPTQRSISLLVEKPAEDLNQIRQIIPANSGVLEKYNIPVFVLSLMLRCKIESDFGRDLIRFIHKYQVFVKEIEQEWRKDTKLKPILDLLNARWDSLDEPAYINYPYIIALTAAGLRLQARSEKSSTYKSNLREMSQAIKKFTPEWLEHDLYFIEAILSSSEGEREV
jgi:hypothetical protein